MYPDCDEILKLANDYDIIPVCREFMQMLSHRSRFLESCPASAADITCWKVLRAVKNGAAILFSDTIR